MKGHSLLVSLAIAILIVGSLVVVGRIATPNQPVVDENPQAEDYNSSRSNTSTSIYVGEDNEGNLWIGIAHITKDGVTRIGTHGGDSVEVRFSEFGDIIVSESRRSPAFDNLVLEAIDEAFSVWEKEMTIGGTPIGINEEGLSR